MVYLYVLIFLVWNMLMASVITIPLYKIVCSLSYLDYSDILLVSHKEYINLASTVAHISDVSHMYFVASPWLISNNLLYVLFTNLYYITCSAECVAHLPISHLLFDDLSNNVATFYIDVRFVSRVSNLTLLEFISLQNCIVINPGESTLVFFRMFNPTSFDIFGVTMYYIFPAIASIYIKKIQCFCFDLLQIYSGESIELPVLFYVSSFADMQQKIYTLIISYVFFVH